MLEAALVFDVDGVTIHVHEPIGRTVASIPDTRDLWQVIWDARKRIGGVAHSHPGGGRPVPSWTDLTTFAAIEDALGQRLTWPIITQDAAAAFAWIGPGKYDYGEVRTPTFSEGLLWLASGWGRRGSAPVVRGRSFHRDEVQDG